VTRDNNNNNVAADLPHVLAVHSHPLWEQLPERNYIEVGRVFVMGWDSSVGIATSCGLDSLGIESRWEARFSAPVQAGAHPASYTMGTKSFPGVIRPGRGVNHHPI
jgi:hypothetical protein